MLPSLFRKLAIEPNETVVSALLAGSINATRLRAADTDLQRAISMEGIQMSKQEDALESQATRTKVILALAVESPFEGPVQTTKTLVATSQRKSIEAHALRLRIQEGQENKNWKIKGDLIMFKDRMYVPPNMSVREELLKRHHDDPYAGHFGTARTTQLLKRKFHWANIDSDVAEYVKSCDIYQKTKVKRYLPYR